MKKPITQHQYYGWIVWFVAALFYATEFFQRVAPTVLAEPISQAFNITPALLGVIMSLYLYAYGAAQIPVGLILDRYPARWILAAAAVIVSLGTLLFAYAHVSWTLAAGRILIGFGSAFGYVGCLKIARDWFSNKWFAIVVGLTNTLGVLGALMGEAPFTLLANHIGWQNSLLMTALIGLLVALLIMLFVRDKNSKNQYNQPCIKSALKHIVSSRQAWLISLYSGLMVAPVIAFAELWSVSYIEKTQHINAVLAAQSSSLIFIGIAIGGPVNSFISDLINRRKPVMVYGNIMTLLLFFAIIFITPLPFYVLDIIIFCFGFFVSSMLVAFPLNTELHPKQLSASIIAFTNMFIVIIGAIFQPAIGLILEQTGHLQHLINATVHDFKTALLILPAALLINLFILAGIKESRCSSSLERK